MPRDPAPIYIGVYLARLETPWASSLKEKRGLVLPVTEKLKARFPVSVARLDGLESHTWELIGVTALSSDAVWLEGMLNKVDDFVSSRVEVTARSLELERWEGLERF